METKESVLEFWFGTQADDALVARDQAKLWWGKDASVDAQIKTRFEPLVHQAASGKLHDWNKSPDGRLAQILITDQFPRNIYRNNPAAFDHDSFARVLCLQGILAGEDKLLRPIQRVFFYLPLEHSESMAHQQQCVALMKTLAESVPVAHKPIFDDYLDYAKRHMAIIKRFGRFPHRNSLLGRVSKPEEVAFLKEPGSSF